MITYKIYLGVFVSSKNGKRASRIHQTEFKNNNPLLARQKALDETKRLISVVNDDYYKRNIEEAQQTFFIIDLIFSPILGTEYKIFGEERDILPSLAEEAKFLKTRKEIKTINIFHTDGNEYEVLQSNLDFFIY